MTVTALRLEPGLEVEGEGGVQVEVLHVDAQLEKTGCVITQSLPYTLQRQNAENLKQIFPEKEYRGLSPNFHIHVSVSELYIPTMGLPVLLEEICRLILGIYKSLKDTGMWKLGLIPRKGIY
jgi:hypothetical protein